MLLACSICIRFCMSSFCRSEPPPGSYSKKVQKIQVQCLAAASAYNQLLSKCKHPQNHVTFTRHRSCTAAPILPCFCSASAAALASKPIDCDKDKRKLQKASSHQRSLQHICRLNPTLSMHPTPIALLAACMCCKGDGMSWTSAALDISNLRPACQMPRVPSVAGSLQALQILSEQNPRCGPSAVLHL